ncbi:unnamed protein product [Chilo suppressalis]|uniref:Arrestin C-terminal-like domain-containing protein n=1 Tax=Chilo suppressalis TaxID=168631 RepID=A0ABN8AZ31_CHISP|nr:unnamed protein product [Chilo suppressalis]
MLNKNQILKSYTCKMTWENNCVVKLNSDSTESFYCGDIVTGTVILKFKRKENIERIDFVVCGTSKASWTRPSPTIPHIKFYSQKKKVLHIDIDLFGNIKGKPVEAGEYEYPFCFALPQDLPSSFESSIAKVEYSIKIKCTGSFKFNKTQPFVVLGNVNLNHIEKYLEPSCHEINKIFWNNGPISCLVKTYTAFSSNQSVPIEVTITNKRKIKLYKLSAFLVQKLKYTMTQGHADEEKIVCKISKKDFQNLEKETCSLNLNIPHLIPSSIYTQDPMIGISYVLRVQLKLPFHLATLSEDIPVIVATVPVLHYDIDEF